MKGQKYFSTYFMYILYNTHVHVNIYTDTHILICNKCVQIQNVNIFVIVFAKG